MTYSTPELTVKGEDIDTTMKDYVATIDGKNYYQETLLNTYILDDEISLQDGVLRYAATAAERVKVTDTIIYDKENFSIVEETSDYMIGSDICTYGLVSGRSPSSSIFIECGEEYSTLVFNLGHINNSDSGNRDLRILYLDSDGEYRETYSYKLNESMPYLKEVSVQIYNTQTVKITVNGRYINIYDQYGLTNMYLVK